MKDLPKFKARNKLAVESLVGDVLVNKQLGPETCLRELIAYQDGHYRAIFDLGYFQLAEGQSAPSKSQWGSLKKRLKRHDLRLFVFKECGTLAAQAGTPRGYVDFGFFAGPATE